MSLVLKILKYLGSWVNSGYCITCQVEELRELIYLLKSYISKSSWESLLRYFEAVKEFSKDFMLLPLGRDAHVDWVLGTVVEMWGDRKKGSPRQSPKDVCIVVRKTYH